MDWGSANVGGCAHSLGLSIGKVQLEEQKDFQRGRRKHFPNYGSLEAAAGGWVGWVVSCPVEWTANKTSWQCENNINIFHYIYQIINLNNFQFISDPIMVAIDVNF